MGNKNLRKARVAKDDEFYTQLATIEQEVMHYKEHFKGKVVYCNCDDPWESKFFEYFASNFSSLGLKKLIVSCYKEQDSNLFSISEETQKAVWLEYTGGQETTPSIKTIDIHEFKGDGDFRSEESIELLKEADIIVTNPPFSLFREYVGQLIEHDKKFLIIGNASSTIYKSFFPLIKDNKVWMGISPRSMEFKLPDGSLKSVNACWWTNLEHPKRKQDMILSEKYYGNEDKYPKYDNYEAINVNRVNKIPKDYGGVMGVPVTMLEHHNPEQFDIVGITRSWDDNIYHNGTMNTRDPVISGAVKFTRLLIQNRYLNPNV